MRIALAKPIPFDAPDAGPFALDAAASYARWREWKLARYPTATDELIVEVANAEDLRPVERTALRERLVRANMAIYRTRRPVEGRRAVRALAVGFGLERPDVNPCADDDGITALAAAAAGRSARYIPYTSRPLRWHTDGYYNPPARRIRAFVLHCVEAAAEGGANALIDPEIAYILLRDRDPAHVAALMHPAAMTVPPNQEDGIETRGPQAGPVFAVEGRDGSLHMRYTARTCSIAWRDDAGTRDAAAALRALLADPSPYVFRRRFGPGEGVIANNVLHCRSGFVDAPDGSMRRLALRARFHDRAAGTGLADVWPEGAVR